MQGDAALAWVRERNAVTERELTADPAYPALRASLKNILDSKERIPYVGHHGGLYYNFWRDAAHPRGLWRRTTLDEYRKPEPAWETVLDLDALASLEAENWVWAGTGWLERHGEPMERCLVYLSRGGGDANVVREVALAGKTFVADGFTRERLSARKLMGRSRQGRESARTLVAFRRMGKGCRA